MYRKKPRLRGCASRLSVVKMYKSVSELLGHSSTQITLDIYTHSVLKNKKDAIANFDNIIKKSS